MAVQFPRPVLADEYERCIALEEVFVTKVEDKACISSILKALKSSLPLPGLEHLKRVKSLDDGVSIVLCRSSDVTDINSFFREICEMWNIRVDGLGQPLVAMVPRHQCLTRQQFEDASKHWPVNYHENKHVARAISGELFDDVELKEMKQYMELAIAAANHCMTMKKDPVGAVVVDAHTHSVLAISCDHTCNHPLQTAVMVCVDLIAQSQGGGVYQLGVPFANAHLCSQLKDCISNQFSSTDQLAGCLLDRLLVTGENREPTTHKTAENQMPYCSNRKRKLHMQHDEKSSQPYLCTGYDLYITREPSIMCAMALVHSRIRRVFYRVVDPNRGALGSTCKLHVQHGLNHHFEVYVGGLCEADYIS